MRYKQIAIESGVALLVILFLYAGVIKLLHYAQFAADMRNQVFPGWLKSVLIYSLPAFEILIALSLMPERTRRAGLWASLILLLAFTIYAAGALLNWFSRTPCSCGGIINILSWPQHLLFNGFFLAIAGCSFWLTRVHRSDQKSEQISF